jgi:hypothetical protein
VAEDRKPRKDHGGTEDSANGNWLMETTQASITFIVRVRPGEPGQVSGIVERVRTGEKHRFHRAEAIGPLIAEMVRQDTPSNPSSRLDEHRTASDGGVTP